MPSNVPGFQHGSGPRHDFGNPQGGYFTSGPKAGWRTDYGSSIPSAMEMNQMIRNGQWGWGYGRARNTLADLFSQLQKQQQAYGGQQTYGMQPSGMWGPLSTPTQGNYQIPSRYLGSINRLLQMMGRR